MSNEEQIILMVGLFFNGRAFVSNVDIIKIIPKFSIKRQNIFKLKNLIWICTFCTVAFCGFISRLFAQKKQYLY